jgi:hypothetical protein
MNMLKVQQSMFYLSGSAKLADRLGTTCTHLSNRGTFGALLSPVEKQ